MPNELSIQGVTPAAAAGDATPEPKPEAVAAQAAAPAAPSTPLYLSPSLQIEPGLGLVVLEFRDATGNVTDSIPSQRQLQAYRLHQATPPGLIDPTAPQPAPHPATGETPAAPTPAPIVHVAEVQATPPVQPPKAAAPVAAPAPAPAAPPVVTAPVPAKT
jgi:hypothetical protein